MIKINDREIIKACEEEITMARASSKVGLHYNTFIRHAKRLGVYKPNQSGKGVPKPKTTGKIPIDEILAGNHPHYQTNKLRKRLISEGIKELRCEVCNVTEWNGKQLSFELDHIDGDRYNHLLDNLRIICPNCHSQTNTYRGKNVKKV
jgi:hypothetical protein